MDEYHGFLFANENLCENLWEGDGFHLPNPISTPNTNFPRSSLKSLISPSSETVGLNWVWDRGRQSWALLQHFPSFLAMPLLEFPGILMVSVSWKMRHQERFISCWCYGLSSWAGKSRSVNPRDRMGEISSYFPSILLRSAIIGISETAYPDLSVEFKCLCVQHKYI